MKPREMIRKLQDLGFEYERNGKGDHKLYSRGDVRVTVPCAGPLDRRLSKFILRQASGNTAQQIVRRRHYGNA